jgi:hypothetical protein
MLAGPGEFFSPPEFFESTRNPLRSRKKKNFRKANPPAHPLGDGIGGGGGRGRGVGGGGAEGAGGAQALLRAPYGLSNLPPRVPVPAHGAGSLRHPRGHQLPRRR